MRGKVQPRPQPAEFPHESLTRTEETEADPIAAS
jgi:hypothetical protein